MGCIETITEEPRGGWKNPRVKKSKRLCLSCRKLFMSDGPGNRICKPCKKLQRRAEYDTRGL